MTTRLQNFINGEFVDAKSGRFSDVIDPCTGEAYLQAPISGAEDVDTAFAAAAAAFESWGRTTPGERANLLLKVADAIEARADEINEAECLNTGKPRGPHGRGRDPGRGRPLPLLRRRGPHAGGPDGGRVPRRAHPHHPARADRRDRRRSRRGTTR